MTQFDIRVATQNDAEAVGRVLLRSYSTLYRGWYRDDVLEQALPAMTRANPQLLASGRYFVAEIDAKIVSCGGWSVEKPTIGATPRLAHVRHFATDPDYLNIGCGGALLQRSIDEARAAGFFEIESVSSLTAEAFYARHGFRPMSNVRMPMGGVAFDCVLMRLPLADKKAVA